MLRMYWLAELLGSLRYLGKCRKCGSQFLSVNQYVYRDTKSGAVYCRVCAKKEED